MNFVLISIYLFTNVSFLLCFWPTFNAESYLRHYSQLTIELERFRAIGYVISLVFQTCILSSHPYMYIKYQNSNTRAQCRSQNALDTSQKAPLFYHNAIRYYPECSSFDEGKILYSSQCRCLSREYKKRSKTLTSVMTSLNELTLDVGRREFDYRHSCRPHPKK